MCEAKSREGVSIWSEQKKRKWPCLGSKRTNEQFLRILTCLNLGTKAELVLEDEDEEEDRVGGKEDLQQGEKVLRYIYGQHD